MKKTEEVYHRYSYLVDIYANKIWNEHKIGMEKNDLKQELRIKLFLAIKSYAKRWKEYTDGEKPRPIPIKFFLKTAMVNKVKDFIRVINKAHIVSLDDMNFDFGNDEIPLEFTSTDIKIGTTRLSELFLDKEQRKIMRLYFLKDFDKKEVKKIYKGKFGYQIDGHIKNGLAVIREYLESNFTSVNEFQVTYKNSLQSY